MYSPSSALRNCERIAKISASPRAETTQSAYRITLF